jgi:hypothetical protein
MADEVENNEDAVANVEGLAIMYVVGVTVSYERKKKCFIARMCVCVRTVYQLLGTRIRITLKCHELST